MCWLIIDIIIENDLELITLIENHRIYIYV